MKKEEQYMELPFEVGDVFKNYKALCEALGEKQRTGGSRQIQHERWEKYFLWRKEGYKYIITEIIEKKFPTHDNNQLRKKSDYEERHKFDKEFLKLYKKEEKFFR